MELDGVPGMVDRALRRWPNDFRQICQMLIILRTMPRSRSTGNTNVIYHLLSPPPSREEFLTVIPSTATLGSDWLSDFAARFGETRRGRRTSGRSSERAGAASVGTCSLSQAM